MVFVRCFPAPEVPFDTEATLLGAGCAKATLQPGVELLMPEDGDGAVRTVLVRASADVSDGHLADDIVARLGVRVSHGRAEGRRAGAEVEPPDAWKSVVCETVEAADRLGMRLRRAGLPPFDLTFYAVRAAALAAGEALQLESLVGDDAWRAWAAVERVLLTEAMAPHVPSQPWIDRSVAYKRRQQRESPPVRRFLALVGGEPVAMVGYAPFAACDLGIGAPGVLVRLRDVGVLPAHRRRGLGRALLRGLAVRAIEEVGATQVLICGAAHGAPAALYRSAGAIPIARCVLFAGHLRTLGVEPG